MVIEQNEGVNKPMVDERSCDAASVESVGWSCLIMQGVTLESRRCAVI